MTDDVKSEVIKKTQDILGKFFRKPPLTEKLLKKPPFRFLHDIITAIIKETGFLNGLFSEEELNSDNIKDKEAKLAFLTKLIDVVKIATGINLTVRASKIVSGQEPEKTNELLQTIGKAIEKKVNTTEAIEHYKKSQEKKSRLTKPKSAVKEDSPKKPIRQSSQTRKGPEKESHSSDHRKRSASVSKIVRKESDAHDEAKEDKGIAVEANAHEKNQRTKKSSEIIDIPPAEPLQDKRPPSSQRRKHSPTSHSKQNVSSPTTLVESSKNKPSSASSTKERRSEERLRRKDSANRIRQKIHEENESQINANHASGTLTPKESKVINDADKKTEHNIDKNENKENTTSANTESQQHSIEKLEHPAIEFLKNTPDVVETRPRTSLRPPTARPISARPAAPRMRAKPELIVAEEIPTPIGNINVIVENSDVKDDDDADDMVVMETRGRSDSLENNSNYKIDNQLTQEHGHLVAQILETQRELVNTDNVDVLPKKVDIAWETGSKRDREAMIKDVDKLRSTIQTLTRATNPLGKLLDYLQEDIEIMQKELLDWRNQYNQLSEQLEKEQMQTQELIEPMKETLKEIDNNMKDQLDKICQTKARIIKNDQKIQRLLSGYL